jgi:hypothetical protein
MQYKIHTPVTVPMAPAAKSKIKSGIMDVRPYAEHCSLDDVAIELGVSRERARQIEVLALKKLKIILRKHGYRFEDLIPDRHEWAGSSFKKPPERD